MTTIPLTKQIAEIERELAMRRRVYPDWVRKGRIAEPIARDRLAALEAVLATLKAMAPARGPPEPELPLPVPHRSSA